MIYRVQCSALPGDCRAESTEPAQHFGPRHQFDERRAAKPTLDRLRPLGRLGGPDPRTTPQRRVECRRGAAALLRQRETTSCASLTSIATTLIEKAKRMKTVGSYASSISRTFPPPRTPHNDPAEPEPAQDRVAHVPVSAEQIAEIRRADSERGGGGGLAAAFAHEALELSLGVLWHLCGE